MNGRQAINRSTLGPLTGRDYPNLIGVFLQHGLFPLIFELRGFLRGIYDANPSRAPLPSLSFPLSHMRRVPLLPRLDENTSFPRLIHAGADSQVSIHTTIARLPGACQVTELADKPILFLVRVQPNVWSHRAEASCNPVTVLILIHARSFRPVLESLTAQRGGLRGTHN